MTSGDVTIKHTYVGTGKIEDASEIVPKGFWGGRSLDPSLPMFREAVKYAEERGLTPDFMPELRSENGVLHAYVGTRRKMRLERVPGWEHSTGYAALVDELRERMLVEFSPST